MGARTQLACLRAAQAALIEQAFSPVPVFRMGFDAHVKAWRSEVGTTCIAWYHADPSFRAAYDARVFASQQGIAA